MKINDDSRTAITQSFAPLCALSPYWTAGCARSLVLRRCCKVEVVSAQDAFGVSTFQSRALDAFFSGGDVGKKRVLQNIVTKGEAGADMLHHAVGVRRPDVAVESGKPLVQGRADSR